MREAWVLEWGWFKIFPKQPSDENFISQTDFSVGMPLYFLG